MPDRPFLIHFARVMLHECSARRHTRVNRDFYWTLFGQAQQARRDAAAATVRDLFGAMV